jgi:hypothetical protein
MVVEMMKTHSLGNVILLVKSLFCCLFVCLSQYCESQYGWVQYVRFMRGSQNWVWNHMMWVNENLYFTSNCVVIVRTDYVYGVSLCGDFV